MPKPKPEAWILRLDHLADLGTKFSVKTFPIRVRKTLHELKYATVIEKWAWDLGRREAKWMREEGQK